MVAVMVCRDFGAQENKKCFLFFPHSICHKVMRPEKAMATHSSTLACGIPRSRSLVGYSPWGHKELDMTEWLSPVKAMVFPVVMYGCESWTIKKVETLKSRSVMSDSLQSHGLWVLQARILEWVASTYSRGLMLSNCDAGEDSWEFLGKQVDQTNQY